MCTCIKIPIFLLGLSFLITGCYKDDVTYNKLPDYRDEFIGAYFCAKTGNYHCGDSTSYYDTTEMVTVGKSGDSMITILDATLKIDVNGEFGGGLYPDPKYHLFAGYIKDDSLNFGLQQGGLGCFTRLNYRGKTTTTSPPVHQSTCPLVHLSTVILMNR
jgi:hypothetical protein